MKRAKDSSIVMFVASSFFSSHTFFHQSIRAFAKGFKSVQFFSEPHWDSPLPNEIYALVQRPESGGAPTVYVRKGTGRGSNAKCRLTRVCINVLNNALCVAQNCIIALINGATPKRRIYSRLVGKYELDKRDQNHLWSVLGSRAELFWALNIQQAELALDIAEYTQSKVIVELVDIHTYNQPELLAKHVEIMKRVDGVIVSSGGFADYYAFEQNSISSFHRNLVPVNNAEKCSMPHHPRRLIFFGNLSPSRKIDEIIEAVSEIDDIELSLYGKFLTKEYEQTIGDLVKKRHLSNKVKMGFIEKEKDILSACNQQDIGLIFFDVNHDVSHENALPTKLGTYLASGLDIISVANKPILRQLTNLENVKFLSSCSVDELAAAIIDKVNLSDEALLRNKESSLEFVRKSSWEDVGERDYLDYLKAEAVS